MQLLAKPPRGLEARIRASLDLFPCDLLFVHRDAEREPRENRVVEIRRALEALTDITLPVVCVVPVRMQEAWLLFDEMAIRSTAGNPNGAVPLLLPRLRDIEGMPDPKQRLQELLKTASGLTGRPRQQLNLSSCARRVAEYIEDFSPLDNLPAFVALNDDVSRLPERYHWDDL